MPRFPIATFLLMCVSPAILASQSRTKVPLPCESQYQVISPTGIQMAVQCKDQSLHVVDIPDGKEQTIFSAEQRANTFSPVYSQDGHWLAVGFEDGSVEVISSGNTTAPRHWKAGPHRVDVLYFFPDPKTLFVGPVDSPGQIWDLTGTPTLRATLPVDFGGMNVCAASPDGKLLVAAGDDTVIRWFDTATWQRVREYRGLLLETFALAFTADGKHVLAGGVDSRITVLDAASATQVRRLLPETGSFIFAIDILGDKQRAWAVYLDDAGEKPPHGLFWDLATAKSVPLNSESPLTCGTVVGGKLWLCATNGTALTISQYE